MKKQIFLLIALFACSLISNAQTSDSPWAVNIGANLVSIQDDAVDADAGFGVPALSLTRYITNGFSIGAQYSLNSLDVKNADIDYSSIDAILKYNLVEGDFLPYLFGIILVVDGREHAWNSFCGQYLLSCSILI